jgi:tRNA (guanine37-N1)-methyltransferase
MCLKGQLDKARPSSAPNQALYPFHVIGDIAIVSIPSEMDDYKKAIAEALILRGRNIKTVLNKISKIKGDGRVALFEILAGDDTVTTHKEFGYFYRLNVAKVFFNTGLGYERRRVASKVRPSEMVLIPFCGIGPFAVPVAFRGAKVVALESSSEACGWLAENARLSGVEEDIIIIKGDAFSSAQMMKTEFDRAIVPTPYGRDEILEILMPMVKKGGMVHF